ncbi:MAG: hypothetical protein FJ098_05985 [Deltaproteobacteria bacterium]|nr:hypothetical protein [Deltaproteobacteria bacterium]
MAQRWMSWVALLALAAGCVNKAEPMSPYDRCKEACTIQCMIDGDCNLASGKTQAQVDRCEADCGGGCKGTCAGECKSNCPPPDPVDTAPDTPEDVPPGDAGSDVPAGPQAVGGPCEDDEGCEGDLQCFTYEFLHETAAGLGAEWTYEIPGGMCSRLFCQTSDQCGEGGFCFDVGPLFEAGMPIGLCLQYCEDTFDCRWLEDYLCYYTGKEGERACLPKDIIADIPCGDGACAETETADACPRDCGE